MQTEALRQQIETTLTKEKVLNLTEIVKQQYINVKDLIKLTFDADQQIGFRAAWILENLLLKDEMLFLENLDELLLRFPQVNNPSCQRHYVKILMYLTSPEINPVIKIKIGTANLETIVETCFDWLINPKVAIAVKCLCCEVLFNLRNRYYWIDDELARQLEFLMKDGSPGIQSKGKKILKALQQ